MALFTLLSTGATNNGTLITDILFSACVVLLFCEVDFSGRALARHALEIAGLFALIELIDVVLNALGLSSYPSPTFLTLFLVLAGYTLLQAHLTVTDRLVRAVSFASLFAIIVGFTGVIMPTFTVLSEHTWGYAVPSAISYLSMVGSALFVRHYSIERFAFVPHGFVTLVLTVDVLGAAASEGFILLRDEYDFFDSLALESDEMNALVSSISAVNLVVDIAFFALILLSCYMFYALASEHDERAELLVTKKSTVDSVAIMRVTKTMYDQLREVRHEIKNHDAYLVSLIDAGEYEKARRFLADQSGERATILRRVTSGNLAIDTVVNAKIALAQSQGVEVETMLAVPAQLPFDEGEIFRLLANLLDNAIEGTVAARAAAGGAGAPAADGKVTLEILPKGGYWFITVRNPCDPARVVRRPDGTLRTSKADAEVHGFGTRVIKRVAERYRGTAQFSVEGGTFTASVMLAQDTAAGTGERKVA